MGLDDRGNFVGAYAIGATRDVVVDERWLVTDIRTTMTNIEELFEIRVEAYGKTPGVTRTPVQVAGLVMPGMIGPNSF
ncbi:hypothetical protein [Rhodocaloribacter sp.]